jgi:hypothetical protein
MGLAGVFKGAFLSFATLATLVVASPTKADERKPYPKRQLVGPIEALYSYGLFPFSTGRGQVPFLFVDQVFYSANLDRAVFMKAGLGESEPQNQLVRRKDGWVLYSKTSNGIRYGVYFLGWTEEVVSEIAEIIRANPTLYSEFEASHRPTRKRTVFDRVIPSANASSCAYEESLVAEGGEGSLDTFVNGSGLASGAFACLQGIGEGVWDATGGAIGDLADGVGSLIKDPGKFWDDLVKKWDGLKAFMADFRQNMRNLGQTFVDLPGEVQAKMVCSILGSLGTDALIAVLTAGGGAAKLALSLESYFQKFSKLERFIAGMKRLGDFSFLKDGRFFNALAKGKITPVRLESIDLFSKNGMSHLAKEVALCGI